MTSTDDASHAHLALDLWCALGGNPDDFVDHAMEVGLGTTWAQLIWAVKVQGGAGRCGAYDLDIEGPCVLLEHSDSSPHYGADDVGHSKPLPFVVRSARE